MTSRYLVPLLAISLMAAGAFAQSGVFGRVTSAPKAGDLAPEVSFDKILSAPDHASWTAASLFGQITVMTFYPNTSQNLQLVARWNALIDQFAEKPVRFVWITGQKESSLSPWLAEHPLKGFVLLDANGATGRSYGMELPATVIIGVDGRIIGFEHLLSADILNAALEGRITTTPLKGSAELKAFIESHKVLLDAQAPRMPRPDNHKPDFAPSYTVHISPSQNNDAGNYEGTDFWSLQGFNLKKVVSELYSLSPIRIELPASLDDDKSYDFSLVLPEPESPEKMSERMRQGLQDYFYLAATRESRLMDVYVVTAPDDHKRPPIRALRSQGLGGGVKSSSIDFEAANISGDPDELAGTQGKFGIGDISSISVDGTVDDFCQALERFLDRPVVNETNLQGEFAFRLEENTAGKNDLLARLREELGLVVEPEQRNVDIVVFNPR